MGRRLLRRSRASARDRLREDVPRALRCTIVLVHRPEFLDRLWRRCDATIRGNVTVSGFRQTDDGVTVTCADGHEFKADLLVGADGIRSVVRRELGHPSRLRYSGTVAYCGVTELAGSGLPMDGGFWGIYLARGVQAGCGPVSNGRAYWFVSVNGPAGGPQGPGAHRDEALAHISPRPHISAARDDAASCRRDTRRCHPSE